jgi:hypothetical protein
MIRIQRVLLISLLSLPLVAQTSGFSVQGGVILGFDSLKKATNSATGLTLGADYGTRIWGTDMPARVGLSFSALPGKELNGLKTSLTLTQAHGDLVMGGTEGGVHLLLGLSLNAYQMSRSGTESSDPMDVDRHFPIRDASGLKLGLRLGLAYAINRSWSTELLFQQTELAGKDLTDPLRRQGAINPAWLELGFRYYF